MLHEVDRESGQRDSGSCLHPLSRFLVTILFITTVISFNKYDLVGLLGMLIFIVITSVWEEISIIKGLKQFRYIVLLLIFIGIFNPFFDRLVVGQMGKIAVTAGMISFVTLLIKGLLTVCAAYFMIITIGIEGVCQALVSLHVPRGAVTVLLLIYRYVIVFLKEIERMTKAYHLRAPRQKGIHIKAWGAFVGLLLIRSIDRANEVYNSMLLRGYDGSFKYERNQKNKKTGLSILYLIGWTVVFILLRIFPVFYYVGKIF